MERGLERPERTKHSTPILVMHLDDSLRRMIHKVLILEGYVAQATGDADEAVRILHASEEGMIVYFEPLFLRVRGHEKLRDYVMDRGEENPHVFIVFTVPATVESGMANTRADGFLMVPFTVTRLLTSLEDAQRLLTSKHRQA